MENPTEELPSVEEQKQATTDEPTIIEATNEQEEQTLSLEETSSLEKQETANVSETEKGSNDNNEETVKQPEQANTQPKLTNYPCSGLQSIQGRRQNMEDTHACLDNVKKEFKDLPFDDVRTFYGVYDGHGGKDAAIHTEKLLHQIVIEHPEFSTGNYEVALREGFLQTDKQILDIAVKESWGSGTTCVVNIVTSDAIYVANVGDSEAVLGRRNDKGFEAILLSQKQKPNDPSERDRIKGAGGHVVFGRVMGSLAVSRAIGDKDFKHPFCKGTADFVSAEPFIAKYPITPEDEFLIIACDGLWDKFTYQAAVDFIADERDRGKTPQEAAESIVQASFDNGSLDNITTIIVYLSNHVKIPGRKRKKANGEEEEDEDDEIDAYEYLRREGERRKALLQKQAESGSPKAKELFKCMKIPDDEKLVDEFSCGYEQTIIYNGVMVLTQNYLCFYSTSFGKRIQRQINYREIETLRKHKSLLVMYALTIETQDRKKYVFNWSRNSEGREKAFKRILEMIEDQSKRIADAEKLAKEIEPVPRKSSKIKRSTSTGALPTNNPLRQRRTFATQAQSQMIQLKPSLESADDTSATTSKTEEQQEEKKTDEGTNTETQNASPEHTADKEAGSDDINLAQPVPEESKSSPVPIPKRTISESDVVHRVSESLPVASPVDVVHDVTGEENQ